MKSKPKKIAKSNASEITPEQLVKNIKTAIKQDKAVKIKAMLYETPWLKTHIDEDGNLLLHYAVVLNKFKSIKALIEGECDPKALNLHGVSPEALAKTTGSLLAEFTLTGSIAGIKEEKYEEINLVNTVQRGDFEAVLRMIKNGASITSKSSQGFAVLTAVVWSGNVEDIDMLISLGADKEAKSLQGHTALMLAAANGRVEIVEKLISLGADKEAKTLQGQTALMIAAANGKVEIIEKLISLGADKEAKTLQGRTALDLAKKNNHLDCIKILEQETLELLPIKQEKLPEKGDVGKFDYKISYQEIQIPLMDCDENSEKFITRKREIIEFEEKNNMEIVQDEDISSTPVHKKRKAEIIDAWEDLNGELYPYVEGQPSASTWKKVKAIEDFDGVLRKMADEDNIITIYRVQIPHEHPPFIESSYKKYDSEIIPKESDIQNINTEIFKAIDHNNIDKVIELISNKPSLVNAANLDGNSAAFMAIAYGNNQIASYLLSAGAHAPEYAQEANSQDNWLVNMLKNIVIDPFRIFEFEQESKANMAESYVQFNYESSWIPEQSSVYLFGLLAFSFMISSHNHLGD